MPHEFVVVAGRSACVLQREELVIVEDAHVWAVLTASDLSERS